MKTLVTTLALVLAALPAARAEEYTFDVDSKFLNVSFTSEMDVEDILGTTNVAKGSLKLDQAHFRVEVPVASLKTGIDMRDEHLRGAMWLDAEKHPSIVFEGTSLKDLGGGKYEAAGTFRLHGVEKPLKATVDLRRISATQAEALGMGKVAWVRIRGEFQVRLSDFGVTIPAMAAAKVNDLWTVRVSLFGKAK